MNKERFMLLAERVADLVEKKGEDYNPGETDKSHYFPFKDYSYVTMIWIKVLRLVNLLRKREGGGTPNFESIEDTAKDLLAYTIFYLDALDKQPVKRP